MHTLNYEQLNNINATYQPSMLKYYNTKTFQFWQRSLFQRAASTLILDVPDEWGGSATDFLYYCLLRFGYVAVFNDPELGTVFNPASLSGINFWYQPTTAIIANPALKSSLNLTIGENCELLKLTPDYFGIFDIINIHAEKLALLDNAINMSIINNKFAFLISAKNKAAAESLKKIFDQINAGKPAVFFDKKLADDPATKSEPWQFLERQNLKQSYLTDQQLEDFQTILNNFDAEIGIPTIPYTKAERMVTSEADSRMIDSTSRITVWKDCLDRSMEKVNEMFGLNLSCKLRYDPQERGGSDVSNDVDDMGV